jgi:hypothetical protein
MVPIAAVFARQTPVVRSPLREGALVLLDNPCVFAANIQTQYAPRAPASARLLQANLIESASGQAYKFAIGKWSGEGQSSLPFCARRC